MLSGTAGEQIPDGGHRPKHRTPNDMAILPVGDVAGRTYEELYIEHAPVARRVALSMVQRDVADDIVAEAFTRVLGAIRAGGGPGLAFRAYLLTAVRNTANDWLRASRRTTVIGDLDQDLEDRVPEENMSLAQLSRGPEAEAEARAEARLVAAAFGRLPTRWRAVLWQLEVEGKAPAAIAPMFGLSANGVSALAVRAREGLRQAYLQQHIGRNVPVSCQSYAAALGADARGRLSRRRRSVVHEHLQHCTGCHALASELAELNSHLGAMLTPVALAGASAALASGAGAGAAKAGAAKADAAKAGAATGAKPVTESRSGHRDQGRDRDQGGRGPGARGGLAGRPLAAAAAAPPDRGRGRCGRTGRGGRHGLRHQRHRGRPLPTSHRHPTGCRPGRRAVFLASVRAPRRVRRGQPAAFGRGPGPGQRGDGVCVPHRVQRDQRAGRDQRGL